MGRALGATDRTIDVHMTVLDLILLDLMLPETDRTIDVHMTPWLAVLVAFTGPPDQFANFEGAAILPHSGQTPEGMP